VLYEYVGGRDQFLQNVTLPFLFEIKRDGPLVRCLREKCRAHVSTVELFVRPGAAALIGIIRMLDLDHVGTQHCQLIGRERAGQHMGGVNYTNALERLHVVLPHQGREAYAIQGEAGSSPFASNSAAAAGAVKAAMKALAALSSLQATLTPAENTV